MLMLSLMLMGMVMGCDEKDKEEEDTRVVAEQYRGTFQNKYNLKVVLTLNQATIPNIPNPDNPNLTETYKAWTDNEKLYFYFDPANVTVFWGKFENEDKLINRNISYDLRPLTEKEYLDEQPYIRIPD